jgi:hypothetical protein
MDLFFSAERRLPHSSRFLSHNAVVVRLWTDKETFTESARLGSSGVSSSVVSRAVAPSKGNEYL